VEFRAGGERIVLDAGTGIRLLGENMEEEDGTHTVILLTHFHWDHIQGLPFFSGAYRSGAHLRICGPQQEGSRVEALLAGQMSPPHFPVAHRDLPASFTFVDVREGDWTEGGVGIRALRVRHPSYTLGYRLEAFGRAVVYVPDNELGGGALGTGEEWEDRFQEFVAGADILVHDAMFTESERPVFEGWGHSTAREAVELALRAEVKQAVLFHHAPGRSDEELDKLGKAMTERLREEERDLRVWVAFEGLELTA
jgi:phosphoribosyl 1,2-cyclic phosphodiesterase